MEHVRTAGVPHASLLEACRFCLFRSPASGSYPLIPIFEPVTCKYFNDLSLHSNANNKVIDTQYTFVLFFRVFTESGPRPLPLYPLSPVVFFPKPFNLQTFQHPNDAFPVPCPTLPRHFPASLNPFKINTYEVPHKCYIQRTYGISKFFRINRVEKPWVANQGVLKSKELTSALPCLTLSDFHEISWAAGPNGHL